MTQVDFYLLPEADEAARHFFACRLAAKAWRQGNRLLIHAGDSRSARELDALLWSFHPESFLPHAILPASQQVPIHIGWDEHDSAHHDLLINLGADIPSFFSRFTRVAEIVSQNDTQRADSRQRYRFYQERGYETQIHDMNKRA